MSGQLSLHVQRATAHLVAEKAFGSQPDSLGIVIVRDLPPNYAPARERLLRLAYRFANLDPTTREKYADPKSRYRLVPFYVHYLRLSSHSDLVLGGLMAR